MANTSEYEVTERAGPRVAGRVVAKGQILTLTEAEAEFALGEGSLVAKGKNLPKIFTEPSKRSEGMLAEARAVRARAVLPPAVADEPEDAPAPGAPASAAPLPKATASVAGDAVKGA